MNNSVFFPSRSLSAIKRKLRGSRSFRAIGISETVDLTLNYKSLSRGAPRESEFRETCLIVLQLRARVVRSQGYLPLSFSWLNGTSTSERYNEPLSSYLPIDSIHASRSGDKERMRKRERARIDSSNYLRRKESISLLIVRSYHLTVLSRAFNQLEIRVILLSTSGWGLSAYSRDPIDRVIELLEVVRKVIIRYVLDCAENIRVIFDSCDYRKKCI